MGDERKKTMNFGGKLSVMLVNRPKKFVASGTKVLPALDDISKTGKVP